MAQCRHGPLHERQQPLRVHADRQAGAPQDGQRELAEALRLVEALYGANAIAEVYQRATADKPDQRPSPTSHAAEAPHGRWPPSSVSTGY